MSQEEIRDLVNARWDIERMGDKLLEIWVRSMSAAALDWYIEDIMGSATEAVYLYLCRLAQDILDDGDVPAGEGDEDYLLVARKSAAIISPASIQYDLDRVAHGFIRHKVPLANLVELNICLDSVRGRMYVAGVKAKGIEETSALDRFVRHQGWRKTIAG